MALLEFLCGLFQLVRRYFQQTSTYDELTDFGPVTPFIKNQLVIIYLTISAALACLALGHELELHWKISSKITVGPYLVIMFALYFSTQRCREVRRFCSLMVEALYMGAHMHHMISYCLCKINDLPIDIVKNDNIIGRLIALVFIKDPRDLQEVFIGLLLVFVSFAIIANFTEVRRRMYILSVLLSAIVLLLWFLSRATILYKPYVIMGFSFFMGYVVAYSQEMVVQIRSADVDYTHHATALFTQIPAFIIHMIICSITRRRRADLSNGRV